MSTKIIDKLAPPQKSPSKIHLVACLQDNRDKEGKLYFHEGAYSPGLFKEITRVGQISNGCLDYDVIIVNGGALFLGHWNDGIL